MASYCGGSLIDFVIFSTYLFVGFVVLPLATLYLVDRLRQRRSLDDTLGVSKWVGTFRRTRLLWICGILVIAQLPWYLPPHQSQVARVADELATRAACPRPGPRVFSDSASGLSAVQRCGIIWAALKSLPPGGLAYLEAHDADFQNVMVLSLGDVMGLHGLFLPQQPRQPWLQRQRMASAWVVVVTITAAEYSGVYQIWVDKRSGVARRNT